VSDNSLKVANTLFVKSLGYATLASPAFTGTPTAPTQTAGNNSTRLATTAFVAAALAALPPSGVTGPASSVNQNIAIFADGTGKVLADGGIAVSSLAPLDSPAFTGSATFNAVDVGTATGYSLVLQGDISIGPGSLPLSGAIRLPNNSFIAWKNAAATGNVSLSLNGSDRIAFGGAAFNGIDLFTDQVGGLTINPNGAVNLIGAGGKGRLQLPSSTDWTGNAPANTCQIICRNNSGKMQLVALFPTGTYIVVASEV
jgi:hypothetical protein